jgi:hypothetical protein
MTQNPLHEFDSGHHDCSLEELNSRNKQIIFWFSFGLGWLWLFLEVFDILWFWEEFYLALSVSSGGIWWSLLGSLLTGIAVGPLVFAALITSYRTKDVTRKWKEEVWGWLFSINPSIIWALMWMVCLPYTWTILPWGEWGANWWKIFPYAFGLIWIGLVPALLTIGGFFSLLFNPKYVSDEQKEQSESSEATAEISEPSEE